MSEEIKLSWKGTTGLTSIALFVGKVEEKSFQKGNIIIKLCGKNFDLNTVEYFYVSTGIIDKKNSISEVQNLSDIEVGDIISLKHRKIRSVYRAHSSNNFLFATIRCNSNCLMCSQPPLDIDDTLENYEIWNYAIDIIETPPEHLTITGGEPTLLGEKLVLLINKLLNTFPQLLITVLSNGRMLALDNTIEIMDQVIDKKSVVFAIPLYSDIYKQHDHIVQAKDAFYQTCLGIHKISSLGFPVEIRVVLHKLSNPRLYALSNFIHMNFPFVYHVTFMGLEIIGYTKANKTLLVEDNVSSANNILQKSLDFLSKWKYNVSIYNTPLCHLPEPLWIYAKQSISDWKNGFKPECETCSKKSECSGFFTWNLKDAQVYPFNNEK